MVQRAYEDITGSPSRLIVFADDLDALRQVPDNVPNQEMMRQHLGISVSRIPDPWGTHESFAAHNNAKLIEFLDRFGFEYEFMSATVLYNNGTFDETLKLFASNDERIKSIILPTLGEERRATFSSFMPIDETGRVADAGVIDVRPDGKLLFQTAVGPTEISYLSGRAKLGWKCDWAMRWLALGVDYEMCGKDLIDSVTLSSRIMRALGGEPPVNLIYEMFLAEDGSKISKSRGNGLTMDQWLRYGTPESLSAFLYREPRKAKKLFPAVVPQAMDDYWENRARYETQTEEQRLANPVHHVHTGQVPAGSVGVTYQLVLNVAETAAVNSKAVLHRYVCQARPVRDGALEYDIGDLVSGAFNYYEDHLAGKVQRRAATPEEKVAFRELASRIAARRASAQVDGPLTDEMIQFEVYEVGKAHYGKENLREWFRALYQVLLGQDSGPRFGAFAVMYGIGPTVELLDAAALENENAL